MKRILIFLFLIPVLGIAQPATDGLVGYWPFNGNANDESGNGNGGVVYGATLTTDRFGNVNSAYSFDGDDYIDVAALVGRELDLAEVSLSLWYEEVTEQPDYVRLISKEESGVGNRQYNIIFPNSDHPRSVVDTDNLNGVYLDGEIINGWNHVVMIYSNDTLKLYQNGELKGTSFGNGPLVPGKGNIMRIGMVAHTIGTNGFIGKIDNISIYNRALSLQEIQNLYTNETTPPINHLCDNIYCDGTRVGIGTTTVPAEYVLAVNGKAIVEEIKVQLNENWPDYVFDEQYHLKDLTHLENYIKTNKHLPNIPKAEEVEKDGYELSEMDSKLLEKIEELTLYLIEQNKKIIKLENRLKEVEDN